MSKLVVPPISPFLLELLDCVCEEVSTHGQGPVCWCGLYPGSQVAWDYCGACSEDICGMAFVRPGVANPYEFFPGGTDDITCQKPIAYSIEVGIVRCAPTMTEDGEPPSAADMTESTLGLMQDMWALHRAIRCCNENWTGFDAAVAINQWIPQGPEGGCVGGSWTIVVDPL